MKRIELLKQRHDLKIALRRVKNAVAEKDPPNDGSYPFRKQKDKVRTKIRRNLKISYFKNSLRRAQKDPCTHQGNQWFTFTDPNCFNQLDEVVVTGTKSKKKLNQVQQKPKKSASAFSTYMNNIDWWDGSIEDPWPNTKWDWFENRQSGDQVWGSIGGNDTGRRLGKNGKIYNSYQGDDLVPAGGGANLKFWAHLNNWAKYGLKGVQTFSGAIEQRNNLDNLFDTNSSKANRPLRNLTSKEKKYFLTHQNQDSLGLKMSVDTLYRYKKVRPVVELYNDQLYYVGVEETRDTILKKQLLKKTADFLEKQRIKNQKIANEIFEKGDY